MQFVTGPQPHPSLHLPAIGKLLLGAGRNRREASSLAKSLGAPSRVQAVFSALEKATVGSATLSDAEYAGGLADFRTSSDAFVEFLRSTSVFYRLLGDEAIVRVPLRTRLTAISGAVLASRTGEGMPSMVSALQLRSPILQTMKATGLVTITDELANSTSPAGLMLVRNELAKAVTAAVDSIFFDVVVDTNTMTTPSTGSSDANVREDLKALLNTVNTTGSGRLYWVGAADVANAVSLVPDIGRDMTPNGGSLVGLPFLVSSLIGAGTLYLIDAAGIAADSDLITIDTSAHAAIQMTDTPLTGGRNAVSLWQTNAQGLKAVAYFGVERFRTNAVAVLTGIDWGDASE